MDYLNLAKDVAQRAATNGAEAEVYLQTGQETEILVDRGAVEKLSHAGSKGLGLRVLREGQMGYAYTSNFGDDAVAQTVDAALALMEASDPDEFRALPQVGVDEVELDDALEIYDESVASTSIDEKVDFALRVERGCLEYSERVAMANRCTYQDAVQAVYLANSRGFADSYRSSFAGAFLIAIGRDGDEQTQAFGLDFKPSLARLDPAQIGAMGGERAVRLLGGRPVPTQRVPVVFDPIVCAGLLAALSQALSADNMQRGYSFLAGQEGQEIAGDMVSILDNGRLPGALGSRPFDAEGVPTRATRLIDEGVLQGAVYDTYSANRAGTRSTGNAQRSSHRTPPSVGTSNFYLQPGHQSLAEIISGVENGFYVINAMNTGGIDATAGEYSSAASGLWIENGQLTHAVSEVTIAATLPEILHGITAVGNDLTFVPIFGSVGAPSVRIDTMMVGGQGA